MSKQVHRINKVTAGQAKLSEINREDRIVFNYPLEVAAMLRDGRCIRTKRIWVQGLPMDISQVIGIIDVLKETYGFPVMNES